MALRNILTEENPALRKVCRPYTAFDERLHQLLDDMKETLSQANGVGLAAPQVGIIRRACIVMETNVPEGEDEYFIELVNPEIIERDGEQEGGEGCLSCPGVTVPVKRQPWARVQYYDLDGELWEIEGDGLLGRCLQHEIDHLNGKTLFESCDPVTRIEALRAYEEAKAAGARPGDTDIEVK